MARRLVPLLEKAGGGGGGGDGLSSSSSSSLGGRGGVGGWMDLSLFRDMGLDVWRYCQGSVGSDVLDAYL